MKVVIQDRTEELNSRLRAYTVRRLGKLSRHFEKVLEAEVHFDAESRRGGRPRKAVKILVHMDGRRTPVLKAEERGQELQATLDRLERAARRGRARARRRPRSRRCRRRR